MLARNTQQMGAGLVMLGGPNSFGAGGWTDTEVEKAMPVDFQIKSAKVVPRGALAMIMHASEIAEGNYWQKVIAREAIKALGPQDYCGIIHWNGTEQWLWGHGLVMVGGNRDQMLARLDRMTPGDMPQFDPSMILAERGFRQAARRRHQAPDYHQRRRSLGAVQQHDHRAEGSCGVTISTVAVGAHGPAESRLLSRHCGGGRAESTTRSTTPAACRGFSSARPAASPGR